MKLPSFVVVTTTIFLFAACASDSPPEEQATTAAAPTLEMVWELASGLDMPESVVLDEQRNILYVSNIVGEPAAEDGEGYISRVSPEGEMVEEQWVTGLDAPKGLALADGVLYVSDLDDLVAIDVESGSIIQRYPAEGAEFLNDVAVGPEGHVFVTDSRASAVYRLADDALHQWIKDDRVAMPNGIFATPEHLIIAAGDASAEEPGSARYLKTIEYGNRDSVSPFHGTEVLGGIDAVEPDERGGIFLSDWAGGTVSYLTPEGEHMTLETLEKGTADLTYVAETDMVYLPVMLPGRLIAYRVNWSDS